MFKIKLFTSMVTTQGNTFIVDCRDFRELLTALKLARSTGSIVETISYKGQEFWRHANSLSVDIFINFLIHDNGQWELVHGTSDIPTYAASFDFNRFPDADFKVFVKHVQY